MTRKANLPDLTSEDFLGLYRRETNARGKIKLLALHHLQQGLAVQSVGEILCVTRKTLYDWLSRYESGGLNALLAKPMGRGRKRKLEVASDALRNEIIAAQEKREGGRISGQDIIELIDRLYGVRYSKGNIYYVLRQLGMSWVSVRSKSPKQDVQAQESFKKNFGKRDKNRTKKY